MARETHRDRQAKVAAMQAKQKAEERKRLWIVIGACALVVLLIVGGVTYAVMGEQRKKDAALDTLSGDVKAASCDPEITDKAEASGNHVGPGTDKPKQTHVDYATVPPSNGPHLASPQLGDRRVYTAADAPAVESLVHNLEHGYTILWYDPSVEKQEAAAFKALAEQVNAMPESGNKFLITPWDTSRGAFPAGKKYALAHWSADVDAAKQQITNQHGNRQFCGGLSATVVQDFVKKHPWSSAPEPGAA